MFWYGKEAAVVRGPVACGFEIRQETSDGEKESEEEGWQEEG
jgi:hypothetical protein